MSRYIDADEFLADESEAYMKAQIELAKQEPNKTYSATRMVNEVVHKKIQMLIADTPSIDIVRCAECKWYQPYDSSRPYDCPKGLYQVSADDFCSYGEREGE